MTVVSKIIVGRVNQIAEGQFVKEFTISPLIKTNPTEELEQ